MNAALYAATKHGEQKYGEHPYVKHLADVYNVLIEFGYTDPNLLTAAWLHDVVEDTNTTTVEIWAAFGHKVGHLVSAVTNEPGVTHAERSKATYPKIAAAMPEAVALKLADRIANMRESIRTRSPMIDKYRAEAHGFIGALHIPGDHIALWKEFLWLVRVG